jgi:hypothetical protein
MAHLRRQSCRRCVGKRTNRAAGRRVLATAGRWASGSGGKGRRPEAAQRRRAQPWASARTGERLRGGAATPLFLRSPRTVAAAPPCAERGREGGKERRARKGKRKGARPPLTRGALLRQLRRPPRVLPLPLAGLRTEMERRANELRVRGMSGRRRFLFLRKARTAAG